MHWARLGGFAVGYSVESLGLDWSDELGNLRKCLECGETIGWDGCAYDADNCANCHATGITTTTGEKLIFSCCV